MLAEASHRPESESAFDAIPRGLFVAGAWRSGPSSFPVRNPANGEEIAHVSDSGAAEALAALDAADRAQASWRAVAPRARATLFHTAHRLMLERADIIVRTMTLESGKP